MRTLLGQIETYFDHFFRPTSNPSLSFIRLIIRLRGLKVNNMNKSNQNNCKTGKILKSLENTFVVYPRNFPYRHTVNINTTNKLTFQILI